MGIVTVHREHGFMDLGQEEAVLRRAAVEQTRRSVILADSAKFGRLGTIRTLGLGDVDVLVTNAPCRATSPTPSNDYNVDVLHA